MEGYVYQCNDRSYTDMVNRIHKEYENDLDRLEVAKKIMNDQQYHHYLIGTLQRKSLRGISKNGEETITFTVSEIDDFLRSVLWLSDSIDREVDFTYVKSKIKSFIETLIKNLY